MRQAAGPQDGRAENKSSYDTRTTGPGEMETLEGRRMLSDAVQPVLKSVKPAKAATVKPVKSAKPSKADASGTTKTTSVKTGATTKTGPVRHDANPAAPVITEFEASNSNGIVDGNGNHSDWIEIQNQGGTAIDLAGWHLTDDASKPTKWTFPTTTLAAGAYLVVFADSTGTPDSAGNLHTNFSLSASGENLQLTKPDGTVVSQFSPDGSPYPAQVADVSYGTTKILNPTNLVVSGASAKAYVPTNASLDGNQWTLPGYDDSTWKSGTTGVGYDGGGIAPTTDLLARWYAPSLNLANNAAVASWIATTGTGTATQTTAADRPTYLTNQINGRAVVHFDGSNDQLKITNQSLAGESSFTVAMVFRTSTAGLAGTQWYNNTGIVDAEVGGVTNDWGTAINDAGSIGAGVGNPDTTLYSASGLADGKAHTVVFVKDGAKTALSIDGGTPVYGTASASARTIGELVFGSLHTSINYFKGDLGEVRLYGAALSDDAARSLGTEMDGTWGITPAPGVFTSKIGLDLQSSMAGVASTADVRVPFAVGDTSSFDTLTLNMQYDDGFVAYLNGTEIARRNAPAGAITYTSTATTARKDGDALTAESIDVSQFVSLLKTGSNVLAIKALNVSANDSDLLVIPQLVAASSTTGVAYMTTPTPGAANQPGYAGLAAPVTYSVPHGYYTSAQSVTLSTPTVGATIVYTTDGSTPTLTNGTQVKAPAGGGVTSTTLNVSSTTTLRAASFANGYLPSQVSAASYLFVADVVKQPEYTPAGAYWDVGMDQNVVNAKQTYSVQQALTAIPTISFTIDNADMFGSANGIYTHPLDKGDDWERPVSVEYFDPNHPNSQFTLNAGVRIDGAVSRDPSRPKKSFKLFFRGEYGASSLDYPIFGSTNPITSFDHLILRAGHSYSWANLGGTDYKRADYLRDEFARDTQKALTGKSSAGDFVQLYINGQYWGLYNAVEDVDQDWAAANYGGNAGDYDIIKPDDVGGVVADDGTLNVWNDLFSTADAAYADGTVDNTEYANLSNKVDMKGLVDYMLDVFYRGDNDAPVLIGSTTSPRNFVGLDDRTTGKVEFQTQDGEISLDNITYDRTGVYGNQNPGRLFQQLRTNGEFRQLVADEVARTFSSGGVLSPAANQARYQALINKINVAIVGESARWGNAKQADPGMRDTYWVTETNWIENTYMPQRTNVVLGQLKNIIPELASIAPTVSVNGTTSTGGQIASGSLISLTNPNSGGGTIYYTTDGSDPRATGGTVATTATAFSAAFPLATATTVNARVLTNGVWSPLTTVAFTVVPPSLRLAEMMYHPASRATGSPYGADEFEYLELVNTGTTTLNLGGMQLLAGISGTIPAGTTLAPGARGVLVRNQAAFQYAYGTGIQILGVYTDKLSDSGEEVRLYDPNSGTNIFDFTYADSWYPSTDGSGYSMVVKDLGPSQAAATVLGVASAWQASGTIGGSPGTDVAAAPAKLSNVVLDDGTAQRSRLRTMTLTFDGTVPALGIGKGAFTLAQTSGTTVSTWTATVTSVTTPMPGKTAVTLAFGGTALENGSLADGRYTLHIDGTKIVDAAARPVDAAATAVDGSARDYTFSRLFGDANGDGADTIADFNVLAAAFGKQSGDAAYVDGMDYDGNGVITIADFNAFASRFGHSV